MQGNDESTVVTQYEEKYEKGFVHLFGFVSGVLVMVLVRFVADYMFGGRHAEPPVICVEVGTQVDLLAYDEELVDDLNSRLLKRPRRSLRAGEEREIGYVGAPGTACAC